MKIKELQNVIEKRCPLSLQEEWDNSGIQIFAGKDDIKTVMTAMEITTKVIDEAIGEGADIIITHHPLFFSPVKRVDCNDVTGNLAIRLIRAGISVYSVHTPFDKCDGGNNDYLAGMLHLLNIRRMETDSSGYCREGTIDGDCNISEYAQQICKWLSLDRNEIRICGDSEAAVHKVGLCTGAGSEFIYAAKEAGCDLFVTGDVKYHTAQTAKEMKLNLLDIGHYGSEKIFAANMASYLRENTDLEIITSKENINPFDGL